MVFVVEAILIDTTKHNDDEQCVWDSQGLLHRKCLGRGTKITILKDGQLEGALPQALKDLIKKNSELINYPSTSRTSAACVQSSRSSGTGGTDNSSAAMTWTLFPLVEFYYCTVDLGWNLFNQNL
uniref:Uncharacterized protein n=1 Tax=Oryza nivara TaxID=4536 RepID=A0A0E0IHE3_ORYNI